MLKYLLIIFLLLEKALNAVEAPEETYNRLMQSIAIIAPDRAIKTTETCLPVEKIHAAASTCLLQLETMIFNTLQHPSHTKEFIGPYIRLWVLGRLGPAYFDLMIPNPGIEEVYEIEKGMYFTGVYTKNENGRNYWIPMLIDITSKVITLLTWEQYRGDCYSNESIISSPHGLCGKWSWSKKSKEISSFCSCNNRNDCGEKNTYIIQRANLVLVESLCKRKCDNKPFSESAKPCRPK